MRGFGAVDGDFVLRVIERLLHVRVGDAGDLAEFGEDFVGYAAIPFRVRTFDLNVHGSGKAEIQDLGGDVGGEKIKSGAGKLRGQLFAELAHVGGGGVMIFVQRDEDVRITGADEAGGAVHVVDGAVRQADVVGDGVEFAFGNCAADGGFNFVAEFCGFLDAGSGLCAQMKNELAAVCAGEEILA